MEHVIEVVILDWKKSILNYWEDAGKTNWKITLGALRATEEVNPLTAGAADIRVLIFYNHIKYHILNMLKIKCDINQQDLKRVDLHFVKSE